jgi:branched-chain amino acid transport system substrate-binding protein
LNSICSGGLVLNSTALTKIQSIILIAIIVVAAVGGVTAYVLLSGTEQAADTIKIGVLADLDGLFGKDLWQGAILASEQLNDQGGILGKKIQVIGEDTDQESNEDMNSISSALNRLISLHKVDFVIGFAPGEIALVVQEIIAQEKIIFIAASSSPDAITQRVLDEYDKYKYYFQVQWNASAVFQGMTDSLVQMREQTGFNKVGYIYEDLGIAKAWAEGLDNALTELGFELAYKGAVPVGTVDFSSYFAAAEAAGIDVIVPLIMTETGIPFVKEWYDRQSPTFLYGGYAGGTNVPESWDWTERKCEHLVTAAFPLTANYSLTSETVPLSEAYVSRWNETPLGTAAFAIDSLLFILPSAIERAGTIETEAVVEALEETSIETTQASNFVFTSAHCPMLGENMLDPDEEYMLILLFQWQNGEMLPVYPKQVMQEAGVSYTFPDWSGPWDSIS